MTSPHLVNHLYLAASIVLGVISQLLVRWQVGLAGPLPNDAAGKCLALLHILLSPWVILAMACTFGAGVLWMLVLTKFELSYAYPFTCLQFIIIVGLSILFFGETLSPNKILGTLIACLGLILIAKG